MPANYFNLNIVQFWFYKTYQEASYVVPDSKNDVSYQMGPPGSQYVVLTSPFFTTTNVGNDHTIKCALFDTD